VVASELGIKAAIDNYYGTTSSLELKKVMEDLQQSESADLEVLEEEEDMDIGALVDSTEEAPVVKLVNLILTDAIKRGASDIHIEPYEKEFRVRFRNRRHAVRDHEPAPEAERRHHLAHEDLAKLDISEKRLPQDGRIKLKMKLNDKNKELDFRVSVAADSLRREDRHAPPGQRQPSSGHDKLGFEPESLVRFEEGDLQPWGMVLVTGPTARAKPTRSTRRLSK